MNKIEQALTFSTLDLEDAPTRDALAADISHAIHRIESDHGPKPWIPSPEELTFSIRENLERQIADVFAVPYHLLSMIEITPFEPSFETELAELDWKDEGHDGAYEELEFELEDLDWSMTPFEEKLAMLDYEDGK